MNLPSRSYPKGIPAKRKCTKRQEIQMDNKTIGFNKKAFQIV